MNGTATSLPPGTTPRALTPDADPSAEMEALRLRRLRHAFDGPATDDPGPSPLARGLLAGTGLGILAVVIVAVAGVIAATWAQQEAEERKRSTTTTAVVTTTSPTTVTTEPPRSTAPTSRRSPTTTARA
jgi:hypothetical protein